MKKELVLLFVIIFFTTNLQAQTEPSAGNWKTWFITSGKDYRLQAPASFKEQVAEVLSVQKNLDTTGWQQIQYWNEGSPGYHWQNMMMQIWTVDTGRYGALANMLLGTAIYDATIAAWDSKYFYKRPRPFAVDNRIQAYVLKPESPSYPCEYSVAAGVAVTIMSHFYPYLSDSVNHMAQRLLASRI